MTLQDWLLLLGAIAAFITATGVPAVIAIIKALKATSADNVAALKENTAEVKTGNEQAATADATKIALSARIADPFAPAPPVDPMEARIRKLEEMIAALPH